MSHSVRLALVLTVTWLLLSGLFKAQLLILGVLSVVTVVWLAVRMRILTHRGQALYFNPMRLLAYWRWLLLEIMRSNVNVTKSVFAREISVRPAIGRVSAKPYSELGDVIYANSITLTPGTTAISFAPDGDVLVHALDAESLQELEDGEMARRVAQVEPDMVARAPGGRALPGRNR